MISPRYAYLMRDYVADGLPSSGNNEPHKSELRRWGSSVEALLELISTELTASLARATKNELDAVVADYSDGDIGLVVLDDDLSLRGIYQKEAGAWVKKSKLPNESAEEIAAALKDFRSGYLGALAVDPVTDLQGQPLIEGALYLNTVSGIIRVFHSGSWTNQTATVNDGDINLPKLAQEVRAPIVLPFFRNLYRKRVLRELPLKPPGYDAVVASLAVSYVYPQALFIDEAASQIFVVFSPAGGTGVNWIVIFNRATGAFIRSFYAGQQYTGIHVSYSGSTRYLWLRGAGNALVRYNITTLPAELSSPAAANSYAMDVYLFLTGRGSDLLINETDTPLGTLRRVDRFFRVDVNSPASRLGTTKFRISDIGDNNGYADYFPHMQAIALGQGFIAAAYGGIYTGGTLKPSHYQGVRIFSGDGDAKLAEALYAPDVARTILTGAGYANSRIENEGCCVTDSGAICSLCIVRSSSDADAATRGIIIFEEFAQGADTIDFSPAAVFPKNPALANFGTDIVLLKSANNKVYNPVTGSEITTLAHILDFMKAMEVTLVRFYSSIASITDVNGDALPTSHDIEIRNENNATFYIDIRGASIDGRIQVAGSPYIQTHLFQKRRYEGSPSGALSASMIGAECVDVTNGNLYIATAVGSGNWKLVTRAA